MRTLILLLAALSLALPARAAEPTTPLTLQEALYQAVTGNLDLRVALFNPAVAEAGYRQATGIYDPRLNLLSLYKDAEVLNTANATFATNQRTSQLDAGLSQLLPSGGSVDLTFSNNWNRVDDIASQRSWTSQAALTLTQPLLKNFGREVTELTMLVADQGREGSLEHYRGQVQDIVAQVRSEYFNLYNLQETRLVREKSVELAKRILAETKARVAAGVLPAMEILNAEFGVAAREKELIDADKALRDKSDQLRLLVHLPPGELLSPLDQPSRGELAMDETAAVRKALEARPDLQEQRITLATSELQARVARNQTLPDLKLAASTGVTGIGEHYDKDMEQVRKGDNPFWSVGLSFEFPIGNRAATNALAASRLKSEQARTQLRSLEESAANEVRSAIRAVQAGYKQLEVADRGVRFASERLAAYQKRVEVGLSTVKDLLEVETELSLARNNLSQALATYQTALTQYWRATGELLAHEGINVERRQSYDLYRQFRR